MATPKPLSFESAMIGSGQPLNSTALSKVSPIATEANNTGAAPTSLTSANIIHDVANRAHVGLLISTSNAAIKVYGFGYNSQIGRWFNFWQQTLNATSVKAYKLEHQNFFDKLAFSCTSVGAADCNIWAVG